ncbi:MAG: hypothetical protein N838_14715 [Thiohalocapsa sp. PB-PSB1]|nr:MAG: hypothetical protein N838_14715 [Thiohalocapsa sp. PB-PSB1]
MGNYREKMNVDLIAQGIGAFLGVIAGTFISYGLNLMFERRTINQRKENFRFEVAYNLRQVERWIGDVSDLRNAINSEALHTWAVWLDFGKVMRGSGDDMFKSGLIYKYVTHDQIGNLQAFYGDFSEHFEQFVNQRIVQLRQDFVQKEMVELLKYLEDKLKKAR